jgi:DNA-binding HxlR family transcriptional regulator
MNTNEVKDALFPNCPIRNILSRIGDKWSMLVLYTLETDEAKRFKELQRNIPDISQKMLTATLRMLEADGLVKREAFAEVPPRVALRQGKDLAATHQRPSLMGYRQHGRHLRVKKTLSY